MRTGVELLDQIERITRRIARLRVEADRLRNEVALRVSPRVDGVGGGRRGHVSRVEVGIVGALEREQEAGALADELAILRASAAPMIDGLRGDLVRQAMRLRYLRGYSVRRVARWITEREESRCSDKRAEALLRLGAEQAQRQAPD